MFIIPGYINDKTTDEGLTISSSIQQNSVLVDANDLIQEYEDIKKFGCEKLDSELKEFLHEQGMLLSHSEIKNQLDEVKNLLNKTLLITLMPTEGCNFRCPYCYENHNNIFMSKDNLIAIQNFIEQNISSFDKLELNWFGGEPTLCMDYIKSFSSFILSLKEKHDFIFHSNITSNGYLLNLENFKMCYKCGITTYQITIDGFTHDKTRPFVDGSGTLSTILDNLVAIHSLTENDYHYQFIIRHNILSNDLDLSWYDYLKKIFEDDPRFKVVVRSVNDWGGNFVKSLDILKNNKKETLKIHQDYIHKIGLDIEEGNHLLFGNICYASYPNGYIFRPNESIVKCSVALDNPLNIIGKIDNNKVVIQDTKNKLWVMNDYSEDYFKCKNILSCLNLNCRYHSLIQNDTHCSLKERN